MVTRRPSWSRRSKSGARTPFGMIAPSKPEPALARPSVLRVAASTRAPSASAQTSTSAMSTRGFTRASVVVPGAAATRDARGLLGLDQAAADRVANELDAVTHPELREQVGAMRLDRLLRQLQGVGDLAVRVCLGDQLDHLELTRGQGVLGLGAALLPLAHQRELRFVRQKGAPRGDRAQGLDQVGVGSALEHVTGGARLEALEEV